MGGSTETSFCAFSSRQRFLNRRQALACISAAAVGIVRAQFALAQDKKDEKKPEPEVKLVLPMGIIRGAATKLTIRGIGLAEASEVRIDVPGGPVKAEIKSKGKADLPNNLEAKSIGDTKLEIEFTLPAETPVGEVSLIVVTPAGEAKPHKVRVFDESALTIEKEPNGGFHTAQEIKLPTTVRGAVDGQNDVDVFRFVGNSGEKFTAEVFAARLGSPLDSLLSLYDAGGRLLAANDDGPAGADSLLHATLPGDGVYYLSLTDANGRGNAIFAYLLSVGIVPAAASS